MLLERGVAGRNHWLNGGSDSTPFTHLQSGAGFSGGAWISGWLAVRGTPSLTPKKPVSATADLFLEQGLWI